MMTEWEDIKATVIAHLEECPINKIIECNVCTLVRLARDFLE